MTRVQRLARWILTHLVDTDGIRRMIHEPKQWLLTRAHHTWIGLLPLAVLGAGAYTGWLSADSVTWTFAVYYAAASYGTDVIGGLAHSLWQRGRIWQDTICPCCDENDGGGWWPEFDIDPDGGPEDHGRTPDEAPRPSLKSTITTPRERAAQAAHAAKNLEGLR